MMIVCLVCTGTTTTASRVSHACQGSSVVMSCSDKHMLVFESARYGLNSSKVRLVHLQSRRTVGIGVFILRLFLRRRTVRKPFPSFHPTAGIVFLCFMVLLLGASARCTPAYGRGTYCTGTARDRRRQVRLH